MHLCTLIVNIVLYGHCRNTLFGGDNIVVSTRTNTLILMHSGNHESRDGIVFFILPYTKRTMLKNEKKNASRPERNRKFVSKQHANSVFPIGTGERHWFQTLFYITTGPPKPQRFTPTFERAPQCYSQNVPFERKKNQKTATHAKTQMASKPFDSINARYRWDESFPRHAIVIVYRCNPSNLFNLMTALVQTANCFVFFFFNK